jgi:isopenicillin N synthase-like dioxygenase
MTVDDFTDIPILDLSEAEDPDKKPLLLRRLRHILFNVGFLYISHTGVPEVSALMTLLIPHRRLYPM